MGEEIDVRRERIQGEGERSRKRRRNAIQGGESGRREEAENGDKGEGEGEDS